MKNFLTILILSLLITPLMAQTQLPFAEIPEAPSEYTATSVTARMVEGLGFRYYWATEGLRPEDLMFQPNEEARTSEETLDHILGLTTVIINSVKGIANDGSNSAEGLDFEQKREKTLMNLKESSDILRASDPEKMNDFNLVFKTAAGTTEYPFWNQINGPISDALWHVGQMVSFRRSSGNPFNSKVSVLNGKVRD